MATAKTTTLTFRIGVRRSACERRRFFGGKNGFVERAVRQAHAALEALADRSSGF